VLKMFCRPTRTPASMAKNIPRNISSLLFYS
jgi:hypothetical protein